MKPPLRALFLGAPGAGKGTQVKTILAAFPGLHPISSGDSLRAQIASNSLLGSQARAFVDAGALVPDTLVTALILAQLESITTSSSPSSSIAFTKPAHSLKPSESASTPSTSKSLKPSHSDSRNWLLDGFPRTLPQAKTLDEFLEKARAPLTVVINLNVPESVIYERIEGRWIHPASGRTYNMTYNPPKRLHFDDITNEPLIRRSDDNLATFKTRMEQYNASTLPLLEYYESLGLLKTFTGPTSDVIRPQLLRFLKKRFF